ncbi:MAG: putative metal-binding motif-containing protein [Myxococcales bacterium]|nr:putative metal-binding motif-containing protein [Myxococcales bacterium]
MLTQTLSPRSAATWVALACSLVLAPAGCGTSGGTTTDGGSDATVADAGPDTGTEDMGHDAGVDLGTLPDLGAGCEGVVCDVPFFRCVAGTCTEYARCFTSATCPSGSTCTGLHCVPDDVDVDGDTYPAATDCNEADPGVNPGATEVCGLLDDNCSGTVDEGDPEVLCAADAAGDVCMASVCCPYGLYNFDGDPGNACECSAAPALNTGATCGAAISVGSVSDAGAGQTVTVLDNALPAGREVWYRFTATDSPDTTCDNFHVRVRFVQNPGNRYRFNLYRGCGTVLCDGNTGYVDSNFAVDANGAGRVGQCPCTNNSSTQNSCGSDTQDFMVRVTWADTSAPSCDPFELEITNGVF